MTHGKDLIGSVLRGTVKWFDDQKGYGFINCETVGDKFGDKSVFVHYSDIQSKEEHRMLRQGQEVEFKLINGPKGLAAVAVRPFEEQEQL